MSRKVLIITYYWPPIGGSGVQRWLKMSRYLSDHGWDPVIFTPENPSFGTIDKSLLKDVPADIEIIRLPIWEPYQLFGKLKGRKGAVSASDVAIKKKKTFLDRIALWIRGNLFIPDPRVFWVRPSVKFLPDIIKSNNIEAVITTGPPHSLHLIGRKLKRKTGVKWIADFRDPWTDWDLYEEFSMSALATRVHKKLENNVLKEADKVLTINQYYKKRFEAIGGREVDIISNGYDEADFIEFNKRKTDVFTIRYIGIIDEMRDPTPFLEALENFLQDYPDRRLKLEFIGNISDVYQLKIKDYDKLRDITSFKGYQPHEEIIKFYEETDVLLLILTTSKHAEGNTTGKIYEYLASGSHILALGPEKGEVAEILRNTGAGEIADHKDISKIKNILEMFYEGYVHHKVLKSENVEKYSRRYQAGKVAKILNEL